MNQYIVKPGHALSSAKGIIGPPVDPKNPTEKEIVTEKHFKNGQKGLTALLQHKKCPLVVFSDSEKEKEEIEKNSKTNDKLKGAAKK